MKTSNQDQVDRNHDGNGHADSDSAQTQLRDQGCKLQSAGSIGICGNGREHVRHG